MAVIAVKCRYCGQGKVVKNGKAPNGLQRYRLFYGFDNQGKKV